MKKTCDCCRFKLTKPSYKIQKVVRKQTGNYLVRILYWHATNTKYLCSACWDDLMEDKMQITCLKCQRGGYENAKGEVICIHCNKLETKCKCKKLKEVDEIITNVNGDKEWL